MIEKIKSKISKEFPNWKLLSDVYINQMSYLEFLCPKEHKVLKGYKLFNRDGLFCSECSKTETLKRFASFLEEYEILVLSEDISDSGKKYNFYCKKCNQIFKDHIASIRTKTIKCTHCAAVHAELEWERKIKEKLHSLDLTYVKSDYKNKELHYICSCGKINVKKAKGAHNIKSKYCQECKRVLKRNSKEKIMKLFADRKLTWIDGEYITNESSLTFRCENNHVFVSNYLNVNYAKSPCFECTGIMSIDEFKALKNTFIDGYFIRNAYLEKSVRFLDVKCPKDHTFIARGYNFLTMKTRCHKCFFERLYENKIKLTYEDGEIKDAIRKVRSQLYKWREDSLKLAEYRCLITGDKENIEVHHVKPFRKILAEAEVETGYIFRNMNYLSLEQLEEIIEVTKRKHDIPGFVMRKDLHKEFHSTYGKDTTIEDLEEFVINKLFRPQA